MKTKATVAKSVNSRLKYVRKFAPSLVAARATLIPFDDLFGHEEAGPQNPAGPDEEPYFMLQIEGHGHIDVVEINVTAETVRVLLMIHAAGEVGTYDVIDELEMTLPQLHDYLRQLPRPPHKFARKGVRQ